MSSYDKTKSNIVDVTVYLIGELQTGLKPLRYLENILPKTHFSAHLGIVINSLLEKEVIEKKQLPNSDFYGYQLNNNFFTDKNGFTGDLSRDNLSKDIDCLGLNKRTTNALRADNKNTVGDLIKINGSWDNRLSNIPNLGEKSIKEIEEKLKEIGLSTGYSIE